MNYKAALFDFDGTITHKGIAYPSQEMANNLVKLSHKMPIGFCTGRQLDSFKRHGLGFLMEEVKEEEHENFLKNLYLLAENGAIGYYFDSEKADFEEFYRVEWPKEFISREKLKIDIQNKIGELGYVYDAHEVCVVTRTQYHEDPDVKKVYACAAEIYESIYSHLNEAHPGFERHLHVGNAGIGVVIGPANGDKDQAIAKFGMFLQENHGFNFDYNFRDILVVGDQPLKGGNDHYFLSGSYGFPFTVGDYKPFWEFPKPVFDKTNERLLNEKGTLFLIQQILKN